MVCILHNVSQLLLQKGKCIVVKRLEGNGWEKLKTEAETGSFVCLIGSSWETNMATTRRPSAWFCTRNVSVPREQLSSSRCPSQRELEHYWAFCSGTDNSRTQKVWSTVRVPISSYCDTLCCAGSFVVRFSEISGTVTTWGESTTEHTSKRSARNSRYTCTTLWASVNTAMNFLVTQKQRFLD
jgi:hypothetical protein